MSKMYAIVLVIILFTAGCQTEAPGDRSVGIEYGDVLNESDEGYLFTSNVYATAHRTDDRTYKNVAVRFYSKNESLINSKDINKISTGERKDIQIQLEQRPEFVVVVSQTFWEDDQLQVFGLVHKEDGVYVEYDVSEDDLFTTN